MRIEAVLLVVGGSLCLAAVACRDVVELGNVPTTTGEGGVPADAGGLDLDAGDDVRQSDAGGDPNEGCNPRVLVLADSPTEDPDESVNVELRQALTDAALDATVIPRGAVNYAGSAADQSFGAIVVTPGRTPNGDMYRSGQRAVVEANARGVGVVLTESVGFQVSLGRFQDLAPLVLLEHDGTAYGGPATFKLSATDHPIWASLRPELTMRFETGVTLGRPMHGGVVIATVTDGKAEPTAGMIVREQSATSGRVAHVAYSAAYATPWAADVPATRMVTNAVRWAAHCRPLFVEAGPPPSVSSISAAGNYTCVRKTNGAAACWGDNQYRQALPPQGTFSSVGAGRDGHACGVKSDGALACWGLTLAVKLPSGPFTSVSVGGGHACGVKTDGTVLCWGSNVSGEGNAPIGSFSSVSAGPQRSTCGVKMDGSVVCWGSNVSGEASAPTGAFSSVSVGPGHSCGVRTNGSVACWGSNEDGRTDVPSGAFASISAGGGHTCGVKTNGTVVCWGRNNYGQTEAPTGSFLSVSAGGDHSCGVRADRSVVCWGRNDLYQARTPVDF